MSALQYDRSEWPALYNLGWSLSAIARAHGVSSSTARNVLIDAGVPMRRPGRPLNALDRELAVQMLDLRWDGLSWERIQIQLDAPHGSARRLVTRLCAEKGIDVPSCRYPSPLMERRVTRHLAGISIAAIAAEEGANPDTVRRAINRFYQKQNKKRRPRRKQT